MGLLSKVKTDVADFRRGFNEGVNDDSNPTLTVKADASASFAAGVARLLLFGFLAVLPGVPFLPWGQPIPMTTTILAGLAGILTWRRHPREQLVRAAFVFAMFIATTRLGEPPSTSMVLIGALITTATGVAASYPFLYGFVGAMAAGSIAQIVFDWKFLDSPELPLSGLPFTPDGAGREGLRLSGFLFVTALLTFAGRERERFRMDLKTAEEARDAAIFDERARIARELHDVVSHHVTAMTLQAEAAAMTGDKQALASVATAGREALVELRRMLGVLRHPDDASPSVEPQPGLDDLDRLAARTSSGPTVTVEKRGDVRDLPAGVELGIFRIVQEAVTNAAKHGDATKVDVVLNFGPDMVTVEIRDNGRPLAAPRVRSSGLGLIGMRERVALLDGELKTGPRADADGFEVVATFPVTA